MKTKTNARRLKKLVFQLHDSCKNYENVNADKCEFSLIWKSRRNEIIFRVFNVILNETIDHDIEPLCRCETKYACFLHYEAQKNFRAYRAVCDVKRDSKKELECRCDRGGLCILHWNHENIHETFKVYNVVIESTVWTSETFSIQRRIKRRKIDVNQLSEFLKAWIEKKNITLSKAIPDDTWRLKYLRLMWTYKDIKAKKLKNISTTNFIVHRVTLKQKIKPFNVRQHRLTTEKEWWLRQMIQKDLEANMYEKTIFVNERTSQWSAVFVFVKKSGFTKSKLTFNYHFVYEKPSKSIIKLTDRMYKQLSISSHRTYFSTDMKHGYWEVLVHSEDRHYLIFHISKIGQLQFTRMPQKTKSFSFTYIELMNIILSSIFSPNPKSSLMHNKHHNKSTNACFYIDDIFDDHVSIKKKYDFLKNHFLPRILWFMMKISLKKLKLNIIQIKTLNQIHRIDEVLNIKQKAIDIIQNWFTSQNQSNVRSFMKIILFTRKWIKEFEKIAKLLNRLQGKIEWRWIEFEKLIFQMLKKLCSNVMNMFDIDSELFVNAYIDVFKYDADFYICQLQKGEMRLILYDSIAFNSTQRNYDTYKRKLFVIVMFIDKYEHIFNSKKVFIIHIDHKLLIDFMNVEKHSNIFAKWAIKLQSHNIRLKYVENKKNAIANDLSRVIFNEKNCRPDQLVKKLYEKMKKHKNDNQWFWRFDKNEYQIMLKRLSKKNRKRRIDEYENEAIAQVDWITFFVKKQIFSSCSDLYNDCTNRIFRSMIHSIQLNDENESQRFDYFNDEWYSNIYNYYALKQSSKIDKTSMIIFKRKIHTYRWNASVKRLLHAYKNKWYICLVKKKIAFTLRKTHDQTDHFFFNIILNRIKNSMFWPHMTFDVRFYILNCLSCAQWVIAARQRPLSSIQTCRFYDLFSIDFMKWSQAFKHEYKHICNMICYFSKALYSYSTFSIKTEDAKQAFQYYQSSEHLLSTAVYWDVGFAFIFSKMKIMLNDFNIIAIQTSSQFHKSIEAIERANRILKIAMRKMRHSNENFIDTLRKDIIIVNDRHIEHLNYSSNEIIYDIEFKNISIVNSVKMYNISKKLILSSSDEMLPLVWNHITRRKKLRHKMTENKSKTIQIMKKRYDRDVQAKIFVSEQYVFFRNINLIYDKNIPRWRKFFVINEYEKEHDTSYTFRKLDEIALFNHFHEDHLRIFQKRIDYLRSHDEKNLLIMKSFRKVRTKVMKKTQKKKELSKHTRNSLHINRKSSRSKSRKIFKFKNRELRDVFSPVSFAISERKASRYYHFDVSAGVPVA